MPASAFIHAAGGIGPNAVPAAALGATAPLNADASPVDLRQSAQALNIPLPRLASRFVQLAVLGARQCVGQGDRPLAPATPVYLATGLGDVARTDALYYQVMPPSGEMASPAQFATSGNNMAAFFVAQQLGLLSRNVTISQHDLSFEHALKLALDDMAAGVSTMALLGGVDETTRPREFYVRRFPPSADRCIGEGSAWLVLGTMPADAIGEVVGVRVIAATGASIADDDWAARVAASIRHFVESGAPLALMPGLRVTPAQATALQACLPLAALCNYQGVTGCLPTAVALAVAGTVAGNHRNGSTYVHVNRDAAGRSGVVVWRVNRASSVAAGPRRSTPSR